MKRLAVVILVSVVGAGVVTRADVWDTPANNDNSTESRNELTHGLSQIHDVAALAGAGPDKDFFPVVARRMSSYEAVVDGQTGDVDLFNGGFSRVAADGRTVLQFSSPADGVRPVQTIRWENSTDADAATNYLVVGPARCDVNCTNADQYHIRFFETTISVARYNNSATQRTLLFIQNTGDPDTGEGSVLGHVWFWTQAGEPAASTPFDVAPLGLKVIDTAIVAPGSAGSITISHNARYGQLAVKAVALEQSTGFSFDTPGVYKPH